MRILLEISATDHKIWHGLAKRLAEIYPGSKFAAIVGAPPPSDGIFDYLKKQKDIKYEFLADLHEILINAFKGEIDHKVLKEFEESLPEKSIWRLVSSDRGWGAAFMHGAIIPKSFINQNNTHENILRVVSGLIKTYRKIFDDFKADIFLPAPCMGSVSVHIYEQICRERGLPYIMPAGIRIKDLFAFASDVQLRFPQISKTYMDLQYGRIKMDLTEAAGLYDQIMNEFESPRYFDRGNPCFSVTKIDSLYSKIKFFGGTLKHLAIVASQWPRQRKLYKKGDVFGQPYKLSVFFDNIANVVKYRYRAYRYRRPGFGEILPAGQKYIYYPLHTSPEYSTQFQATMWMDQVYLIEQLAKSIPFDWVVYVKEHPAIRINRIRPIDFYRRITRFPNVRLAPIDMDMHKLISNAEMVAVVTGTTGWEAIQRGKPVIGFADNFWDVLGLSCKYTNIENLSLDIYNEMCRIKMITREERKRRIVYYFAAALKQGFKVTHPAQFCYEDGTDEQYDLAGREMADALKKYLEYLNTKDRTGKVPRYDDREAQKAI